MNQHFEEDKAELEAHFQERVQAYIELGETPEQALLSAREKFGEMQETLNELRRRRRMRLFVGKPLGVLGIGLFWGPVWAALFAGLLGVLQLFLPPNSEPSLLEMLSVISGVGFISGSLFGALLSVAEDGKALRHISLGRAALWGTLSSAVFPLLTDRADQVIWTCPFGALVAVLSLSLARNAEQRATHRPKCLRDTLLACVHTPIRYAVRPSKRPVRL